MPKGIYQHKPLSEEHRKRIGNSLKGRNVSAETRDKIRNSLIGRHKTTSTPGAPRKIQNVSL